MNLTTNDWDERRGRRRRRLLLVWLRLTPEERVYGSALVAGLVLVVWAALQALQAQGRFPAPPIALPRLPIIEDISLPGRPVLLPVLEAGELRTVASEPAAVGALRAQLGDDLIAETSLPLEASGRELMLVVRGNLPRIQAPPPPVRGFQPLRLVEVDMVDARTGEPVSVRGIPVQVRVLIRPIDLQRVNGDPSRLLLLHWVTVEQQWDDTHARVDNGYLAATVVDLSPFAVGVVEEPPPDSGVLGLLRPPATSTSTSTSTSTATPTPTATSTPAAATPTATRTATATATPPPAAATATPTRAAAEQPAAASLPTATPTEQLAPVIGTATPTPVGTAVGTATPTPGAPGTATPTPAPPTPGAPGTATPTPAPPTATPTATAAATATATATAAATATATPTEEPTATPVPEPTSTPTPVPVIDLSLPSLPIPGGPLFNVPSMRPGETATAEIVIQNGGNLDFTYTMTVEPTTSSPLDADPVNGLQLLILRCGPSFTLCSEVVYAGPAVMRDMPMGGPQSVGPGRLRTGLRPASQDYLRLQFSFPSAAGNPFQQARSVLRFVWTATQAL